MRKAIVYLLALLTLGAKAEEHVVYFDNSLTQWQDVYCYTWSHDTQKQEMGDWPGTISRQQTPEGYYRFVIPSAPTGGIIFDNGGWGEGNQTADLTFINDGLYTYQGYKGTYQGEPIKEHSGTLPVMYLSTLDGAKIQKENYIEGSLYIDAQGIDGFYNVGTPTKPLAMNIRGRGNYTWKDFDKKPYKIKLSEKASLLGMNKGKQFALLAGADDRMGFLRNPVGFALSRILQLPYTPACQPVEVYLNGAYQGLYFLTESIKVEKKRVNITEQADNTDSESDVTGGWLMEIDNYDDSPHIDLQEGNGQHLYLTYHSPKLLSRAQEAYLTSQMNRIDSVIYHSSQTSDAWEAIIDKDAAVRYYIVQEIMEDTESYHGSCFFYKDQGQEARWTWGPVWDFGNAFQRRQERFIYDNPQFAQHWIGALAQFRGFQEHIREVWSEFLREGALRLLQSVSTLSDQIAQAAQADAQRWPQYANAPMSYHKQQMLHALTWRIEWLKQQWGTVASHPAPPDATPTAHSPQQIYTIDGQKHTTLQRGFNIVVDAPGGKARKVLIPSKK